MSQFPEFPGRSALRSDRSAGVGVVAIKGRDRMSFLTRIMAGDLPRAPGSAPTALLGPRGNLVAAGVAVVLPDVVAIECESSREETLLRGLDRYRISDDVEIGRGVSRSGTFRTEVPPEDLDGEAGRPGWVRPLAGGYLRREFRPWPAFTVFGGSGEPLPLRTVRERPDVVETTPGQREYLRILAGEPRWGAELDERCLPLQSGLAAHVRLGKGCYIGQEYVARQAHRGRIRRILRRLDFDGGAPEVGAEVRFEGQRPCRITSAAARPTGWRGPAGVALAVVSADVPPGCPGEVRGGLTGRVAEI